MSSGGPVPGIKPAIWADSLLVELVRDLTDRDGCSFDHHGYCQAHFWLTDERPCPHGRAKRFLAAVDEAEPPVQSDPAPSPDTATL